MGFVVIYIHTYSCPQSKIRWVCRRNLKQSQAVLKFSTLEIGSLNVCILQNSNNEDKIRKLLTLDSIKEKLHHINIPTDFHEYRDQDNEYRNILHVLSRCPTYYRKLYLVFLLLYFLPF